MKRSPRDEVALLAAGGVTSGRGARRAARSRVGDRTTRPTVRIAASARPRSSGSRRGRSRRCVDPPRWIVERTLADADDGPITVWSNWNVRETMPEPLHPLTWSLWRETILPFLTERFFGVPRSSPIFDEVASLDRIQGRVYFNLNAALAIPVLGPLLRATLHHVDYRAGAVVDDLLARGVLTPRRLRGGGRAPALRSLLVDGAVVAGDAASAAAQGLPRRSRSRPRPRSRVAPPSRRSTSPALLAELRLWESTDAGALRDGMQMLTVTLLIWIAADRLFAPFPDARRLLVAGIRGNPTTEISVRLDQLIEAARPLAPPVRARARGAASCSTRSATTADGRAWLDRFRGFLAFCGQRGPREFDLAAPRWSDDPTMVLDLVRLGLAEPDRERGRRAPRSARRRARRRRSTPRCASAPLWKRPLLRRAARAVARDPAAARSAQALRPARLPAHAPGGDRAGPPARSRRRARRRRRRVLPRARGARALALARSSRWRETGSGAPRSPSDADLAATIERAPPQLAEFHARAAPDFVRSDGVPVDGVDASDEAAERRRAARHRRLARRRDRHRAGARSPRSATPSRLATCWWWRSPIRAGRRSFRAPPRW